MVLAGAMFLVPGCGPTNNSSVDVDAETDDVSSDELSCQRNFDRAISAMMPEKLGIQSDRLTAALLLNEWSTDCVGADSVALAADYTIDDSLLESAPAISKERLFDLDFSIRDVAHVRNCYLFQSMAEHAIQGAGSELEQVLSVFEFVIRNVSLYPDAGFAVNVPATSYEACLFGFGAPQDRAWIFADLLRQLKIDCVIIAPRQAEDSETAVDGFLVGVPLSGKVYLFDTLVGVPVPGPNDDGTTPFVEQPATLKDIQQDTAFLESMDFLGEAGPQLAKKDWSKPRIQFIGTTSLWSPRLISVQTALAGELQCDVFDSLTDIPDFPSVKSRFLSASKLDESSAEWGLWDYPESMVNRFEKPNEIEQNYYETMMTPLLFKTESIRTTEGQEIVNEDGTTEEELIVKQRYEQRFLIARIEQLAARFENAVPDYLKIRIFGTLPSQGNLNRQQRELLMQMTSNAHYWTAVSQYELNDYTTATQTLLKHDARYNLSNPTTWNPKWWEASVRILLAFSLIRQGQPLQVAFEPMGAVSQQSPEFARAAFYLNRWNNILKKKAEATSKEEVDSADEDSPAEKAETESKEESDRSEPSANQPESVGDEE